MTIRCIGGPHNGQVIEIPYEWASRGVFSIAVERPYQYRRIDATPTIGDTLEKADYEIHRGNVAYYIDPNPPRRVVDRRRTGD